MQVITEEFFFNNALLALRKGGQETYDTREPWRLEDIKAAQAAVGADVEYQGWANIFLLQEPPPPFGLERLLPIQLANGEAGACSLGGGSKFWGRAAGWKCVYACTTAVQHLVLCNM